MNFDGSTMSVNENGLKNIDMIDFERRQRQIFNELAMKRSQVEELKKELDSANLKIHELTRSLQSAKSANDEHEHNLNLALKNTRFLEDKLQTNRDQMSRTHMQQESAIQERQGLRELLQKTELQNYNLVRELNELKAQHDCDVVYQKDLMNQNAKIRTKIAELTEAIRKMQIDQNGIVELTKKVEVCEELQKTTNFYRNEFYKYKQKYNLLEEKYIFTNAALEKFKMLSVKSNGIFTVNQETKIIMGQWKRATEWHDKQSKIQNEVINGLSKSIQAEKEANLKICKHEAELEILTQKLQDENKDLKAKLAEFSKETNDCEIQTDSCTAMPREIKIVKTEFIEIHDDI